MFDEPGPRAALRRRVQHPTRELALQLHMEALSSSTAAPTRVSAPGYALQHVHRLAHAVPDILQNDGALTGPASSVWMDADGGQVARPPTKGLAAAAAGDAYSGRLWDGIRGKLDRPH